MFFYNFPGGGGVSGGVREKWHAKIETDEENTYIHTYIYIYIYIHIYIYIYIYYFNNSHEICSCLK